jgi:hypothetical protein
VQVVNSLAQDKSNARYGWLAACAWLFLRLRLRAAFGAALQLSGGAELRRQLEVQLGEANTANSSLQAQLDRATVNVETLTARMAELSSQLANSSEMGGSLRVQNSELMSELAILRCDLGTGRSSSMLLAVLHTPRACERFLCLVLNCCCHKVLFILQ